MCSSATFVSTTTRAARTFVASSRPPSPASTTATSTRCSANSARAAAVITSNCVAPAACDWTRASAARDVGVGAVDLDPLGPTAHVRRDVRADTKPRVTEERRRHQRRRGLPVRADDVDRRVRELRVAERGEQFSHAPEPELLGPRREALEPPERVVSRRGPRAHGGTARASPAPPRRRPPGPSRRSARSRASPRNGRSPSSAAPARPRPHGRRSAQSARV